MPVHDLKRFANIIGRYVFTKIKPFVKSKGSYFKSIFFVSLDLSNTVSAIVIYQQRVDYGDKYTLVMEDICDGFIIRSCVFHDDFGFT